MMKKYKDGWQAQNQGNENRESMTQIGGLMVFAMISTSFGTLIILSSIIELMKNRIKA